MLKQGLNQKLLQKLSPQQIQYIQLLQLNTEELQTRLEEELTENPALEQGESNESGEENEAAQGNEGEGEPEGEGEAAVDEMNFEDARMDDMDVSDYLREEDQYGGDLYQLPSDPNEENKEVPIATQSTLYERLLDQLHNLSLSEREFTIGEYLIGMLDDDGYLRRPLRSLAYDLAFLKNIQTQEEELETVLGYIHGFEPAGIGARDLRECLLLQLGQRHDLEPELHQRVCTIVERHLENLANKHYPKILKALNIDREQLREAMEVISHLNPKPGESQVDPKTQYITPDFIITRQGDDFHIALNGQNAPDLHLNSSYQQTLKSYQEKTVKSKHLKEQVQYIKQKVDAAKWFIDAIRQRQQTLLHTMRTIVDLQRPFFESGDEAKLRPMILKDVAERIGMDISTVSRVVNSKYAETEHGIFSLKDFFSEGIQTDRGDEVSNREVKKLLQEFIDAEPKSKPLTDDKLTDMLKERGYQIARRTVAKYREQLDIPVARLRKEL